MESNQTIISEYRGGLSMNELARAHRMGNRRVRKVLHAAGVLRGWGKGRAYVIPLATSRVWAAEYASGTPMSALMRKYHVGREKVCDALVRHGARP